AYDHVFQGGKMHGIQSDFSLCFDAQKWLKESGGERIFLLEGVEIDQDNNIVLLDQEMASMRAGQVFLSYINDNIPRILSSMVEMMKELESQRRPLTEAQFQKIVLSMVYSAHQVRHDERKEKQEAWSGVLLQLANITVHELRGSYLFSNA
uniref:Uncharacterized protein n=1 Tax=Mastacembelus armatus TaxID=205130 RepID=A0A7N8YJK9_9TELE